MLSKWPGMFTDDIKMRLGTEKCATLVMRRGKKIEDNTLEGFVWGKLMVRSLEGLYFTTISCQRGHFVPTCWRG